MNMIICGINTHSLMQWHIRCFVQKINDINGIYSDDTITTSEINNLKKTFCIKKIFNIKT